MPARELSIAAGMLLDVSDPVDCVEIAAAAGFDALGLRFIGDPPTARRLQRVRAALERTGLYLLDLEMVILAADGTPAASDAQVLEIANELAPRHLTTVSYCTDAARTTERLADVCDAVGDAGVVPALEFLPFSGVRTFAAARRIVEGVAPGRAAVLVDALHVERSGDVPETLSDATDALIPYVQLCDAPALAPDASDRGLYREAVAGRSLPGDGELPLERFLAAIPATAPLSVEVLSEALMGTLDPSTRAARAMTATRQLLERTAAPEVDA